MQICGSAVVKQDEPFTPRVNRIRLPTPQEDEHSLQFVVIVWQPEKRHAGAETIPVKRLSTTSWGNRGVQTERFSVEAPAMQNAKTQKSKG